ncbi:hypothetical protein ABPG74_005882 [Tetrahymena malaccensis]
MENNEDISALLEDLNKDYQNQIDINIIKKKIQNINQRLSQIELDEPEKYEFLKYKLSALCVSIYEHQNDQRSVSQFLKLQNQYLEGYEKYSNDLYLKHHSLSTQGYNTREEYVQSTNSLDETIPYFENRGDENQNQINIIQNLIDSARDIDQSNNSYGNITESYLRRQDEVLALVKFQKEKAENHEIGILVNGAGRVAQRGVIAALNISKGLSCWASLVIATGVAAFEAVALLKKYYQSKSQLSNSELKKRAKKMLIEQLSALGVKTFTTFGITTGCIIGGTIIGSSVPGIGTFLGSILGAIVGTILSFIADKWWQNVILDEKKLIKECEQTLDLDNYLETYNKNYNKSELEKQFKSKMLSVHPDKFADFENLQNLNKQKLLKYQFAKEMIMQHNQWK